MKSSRVPVVEYLVAARLRLLQPSHSRKPPSVLTTPLSVRIQASPSQPPLELLQADLNGDGVLDFIAAQGNQELLSNSSGGYTLHHFSSSVLEGGDMPLVAGDFNGDGKNDVLFYAYTGGETTFLSSGMATEPATTPQPNRFRIFRGYRIR